MMMEALPSLSNTQAVLSFPGSLCAPLNKHTHTHILSPRSAAHLSLLFFFSLVRWMANWVMKKEAVIDKTSDGIGREVVELMNPTPFKERLNF